MCLFPQTRNQNGNLKKKSLELYKENQWKGAKKNIHHFSKLTRTISIFENSHRNSVLFNCELTDDARVGVRRTDRWRRRRTELPHTADVKTGIAFRFSVKDWLTATSAFKLQTRFCVIVTKYLLTYLLTYSDLLTEIVLIIFWKMLGGGFVWVVSIFRWFSFEFFI